MKKFTGIFLLVGLITTGLATSVMAQNAFRATDHQVQQTLNQMATHAESYRASLRRELNRNQFNGTSRENEINGYVRDFQLATDQLADRFRNRRSAASDVEDLLTRGWYIDNFMRANQLGRPAEQNWRAVRSDLQTLSRYYNVPWRWDTAGYNPSRTPSQSANRLTGTYVLDTGRSENVRQAADRAVRGLNSQEADRVRNALYRRLDAPERIAIEQNGRRVSIASTSASRVTIEADGRSQTETRPNGRTVNTTASFSGNGLTINSTGDRGSDFSVTFDPMDNGRSLRVTKRIYTERLSQPAEVTSIYNRVLDTAQLNLYDGNRNSSYNSNHGRNSNQRDRRFAIPNETTITATLNNDLTTKQSTQGERFTLTVNSPRQYRGAVIEGYIAQTDRSGRLTGRSEMSLEFQRLRMNGREYDFGGYIDEVRTPNGDKVEVNNEGEVREDDSQTTQTITRSGIGAAIGAIIGGIAGGGKGAAIGAAVGAGAGAGSVLIQGRDDLDLPRGTEFVIRSSAPSNNY